MSPYDCIRIGTLRADPNGVDHEFTQLMKGLQGERLRQAFKYFDSNQDGFIRPDQFKRIILVRIPDCLLEWNVDYQSLVGTRWA